MLLNITTHGISGAPAFSSYPGAFGQLHHTFFLAFYGPTTGYMAWVAYQYGYPPLLRHRQACTVN